MLFMNISHLCTAKERQLPSCDDAALHQGVSNTWKMFVNPV